LLEEVDEAGTVRSIRVTNPLSTAVLAFEGEQIAGGKQDRIFDRPLLIPEHGSIDVSVLCVERGRWSYRSWRRFKSSPHAAYPKLRYMGQTVGQAGVWSDVRAKSTRLGAASDTDAAEALYTGSRRKLDCHLAALPCHPGECGSIVAGAGKVVCFDFISRPDVHARVYAKLLRGYALDAIEAQIGEPLAAEAAGETLTEIAAVPRRRAETAGSGELYRVRSKRLIGWELRHGEELIALAVIAA
jgi:hypothetical protein